MFATNESIEISANASPSLNVMLQMLGCGEITIFLVLCVLTSVTIAGNLLVMLAVVLRYNLRQNVTNCFIASLAAADFFLGAVVMPFAVVDYLRDTYGSYLSMEAKMHFIFWPYGRDWCDLWHASDVLSSTASILNLCMISVERYVAVSDPFNYPMRMTHKKCLTMIAAAWICSMLISFPAILWWRKSNSPITITDYLPPENSCIFSEDRIFLFLSSCISFHIPLIVMVILYFRIYRTATTVLQSILRGSKIINGKSAAGDIIMRVHKGGNPRSKNLTDEMICSNSNTLQKPSFENLQVLANQMAENASDTPSPYDSLSPVSSAPVDRRTRNELISCSEHKVRFDRSIPNSERDKGCLHITSMLLSRCVRPRGEDRCQNYSIKLNPVNLSRENEKRNGKKRSSLSLRKRLQKITSEQRAAKTLGIIMGAFVLCWVPFFTYNTLKSLCPSILKQHNHIIFPLFTWLGYINSSINPFIYAYSLRDIKRSLSSVLCGFCLPRRRFTQSRSQPRRTRSLGRDVHPVVMMRMTRGGNGAERTVVCSGELQPT
ncbi:unnamed protein product [Calicophoron daubneyi]|uniref:G-protein coupled receptors family 1 profile domain-containing protein n=1 Tax=Calicophoron daubneyi TaxID=300641 RepID=A0AAV2TBL9_CALDB